MTGPRGRSPSRIAGGRASRSSAGSSRREATTGVRPAFIVREAQDDVRGVIEFEVAGPRGGVDDPRHARDYLGFVTVQQEWGPVRQEQDESSRVGLLR
jgi:hypothetical protein